MTDWNNLPRNTPPKYGPRHPAQTRRDTIKVSAAALKDWDRPKPVPEKDRRWRVEEYRL